SDSVKIRGLIARNLEEQYSRKQATSSLEKYLQDNNIVSIEEIDTRALVAHVRTKGAMNCIISSEILDVEKLKEELAKVPSMDGLELASKVSTQQPYEQGDKNSPIKIAVIDYGVKQNILTCMTSRGAHVKVFPATATVSDMKSFNPNGYFISNGPGDPGAMDYAVNTLKEILQEDKPVF